MLSLSFTKARVNEYHGKKFDEEVFAFLNEESG
jgi:hypothetical protein